MEAVANVVINRVAHGGWWGRDIISVCIKPHQFSCWNLEDPNYDKLVAVESDDPQFSAAQKIALNVINGENEDTTYGADSYVARFLFLKPPKRADGKPNWWENLVPVAEIGNHVFYRTV